MDNKARILIVDDDAFIRKFLKDLLEANGYLTEEASCGFAAVEKIKENEYDAVVVDLKLGDIDGLDVLKAAKAQEYAPEVLLVTAYGTIESAVQAAKQGAYDYLTKPVSSKKILLVLKRALERRALRDEVKNLRREVKEKYSHKNIITESAKMRKILELIDIISRTDSTVLIEGESGTGKELIARAIHFGGTRAARPYIVLNCAAIPEALLESELFGHVKGSFTGAFRDKKGIFEEADGGTLFLDEIGDMPLPIQVKLLRVLQEDEIRRVGSNTVKRVDVRVIASTNRYMTELLKEGKFREDLYYRLNVVPIGIPPLRERKEDIIPLANYFFPLYNGKLKKDIKGFSPEVLKKMLSYDWPGNIRELENVVERSVVFSCSQFITASEFDLICSFGERAEKKEMTSCETLNLNEMNEMLERETILQILEKNRWNQTIVARKLGIARNTLWRKMKKYQIKISQVG